jgi:hypothetical protein
MLETTMTPARIITALGLAAAIVTAPSGAAAQTRGRAVAGRAVRRAGPPPRTVRPNVARVVPYGPFYYPYRPGISLGFGYYGYPNYYGYGYPGYYAPYGYGYRYPGYGYGYADGYSGYGGRAYGGVRIDVPQKDAEVYADGYFVGNVDDFDGPLQRLNLEAGPHRIEIRIAGEQPISFDVNVEPGRTITYRTALRAPQP